MSLPLCATGYMGGVAASGVFAVIGLLAGAAGLLALLVVVAWAASAKRRAGE